METDLGTKLQGTRPIGYSSYIWYPTKLLSFDLIKTDQN